MKLHPDQHDGLMINAHGAGWISVDGVKYTRSVLVDSRGSCVVWDCPNFEALGPQHFEPLLQSAPELVILGSGRSLRFADPAWWQPLMQRRIGVEFMDTGAACRTYNLLASEHRHVLAALILE